MARKRRTVYHLLKKSEKKQIREFSKFIPSLEKYKGKERITTQEYSAFQRAKAKLKHTENLKPLTEAQAKKLKGYTVGKGIRAIRLRNTSPDAKVKVLKGGLVVVSNGRDWEYHPVASRNPDKLIEAMLALGKRLFFRKENPPWQLHIWTAAGRVSGGATAYYLWARDVAAFFNAYQGTEEYVRGAAALIRDQRGYRPAISEAENMGRVADTGAVKKTPKKKRVAKKKAKRRK